MNELKTRIQHKHDTADKWAEVESTFKPLAGELIVYDADDSTTYPKFKFGDGKTTLDKLPFVGNDLYEYLLSTFVPLEDGKSLISDDLITKLENISEDATKVEASTTNGNIKIDKTETTVYTHPTYNAIESGLYKVTVDAQGHVSKTEAVTKEDITSLGIPGNSEENQNAFSYVQVGDAKLEADDKKDTLNIAEGGGIQVILDSDTDKITIANSGVREVSEGTTPGTIHVNTAGTAVDVAVKDLKSAAFTESSAYAPSGHTHNYAGSESAGGPANSVKSLLKVGSQVYDGSSEVVITAADLGLEKAMSFIGSADAESNIFDGSKTSTILMDGASVKAEAGDVVLFGGYEYVWTGSVWEQLGQEGSFALKDHKHAAEDITSGTLSSDRLPTVSISKGGTGATTDKGAQYNLLHDMSEATSSVSDSSLLVYKYADPSDTNGAVYYQSAPDLWTYMKGKVSSDLSLTKDNYGGTSVKATQDADGNIIDKTYAKISPVIEDSSVTFIKEVPEDSNFVEVTKIGGITRKCTNLIPFPYLSSTHTKEGVTCTVNNDGHVSVKGNKANAGENISFFLTGKIKLPAGDYQLSGFQGKGSNSTYYFGADIYNSEGTWRETKIDTGGGKTVSVNEDETVTVFIRIAKDYIGDVDFTVYPMLNSGDTVLPYEPYFEGLRSAPVTEVKNAGANLFDCNTYLKNGRNYSFSVIPNKRLYRNQHIGYSSGWGVYDNVGVLLGTFETYAFSSTNPLLLPSNASYIECTDQSVSESLYIGYDSDTTYRPYVKHTLPIPKEVQALEGYGWGINDKLYNYIDFEKKQFVKRVGCVDMGTVDWVKSGSGADGANLYVKTFDDIKLPTTSAERRTGFLCARYNPAENITIATIENKAIMRYTESRVYVRDDAYADAASFKNAMSGVMLYYELADPIITDISDILPDNSLKVEGGGTLTFDNKYQYDVPGELKFYLGYDNVLVVKKLFSDKIVAEEVAASTHRGEKFIGDLVGNANTATKLKKPVKIGEADFNGSQGISLASIAGRAVLRSTATVYKDQYIKFATVNVSDVTWSRCSGMLAFHPAESKHMYGILAYYFSSGSTIDEATINLAWISLSKADYSDCVCAVKEASGIYGLYYKPISAYDSMCITNLNCYNPNKITLENSGVYVESVGDIAAISSINSVASRDVQGNIIKDTYAPKLTGAASSIAYTDVASGKVLISDNQGKVSTSEVSSTELGYLDGVTSNVQTQLDAKVNTSVYNAHKHSVTAKGTVSQPTFTGTAASHNHTFTGTAHDHSFIGSAVTSGAASATISINSVTSVGTAASHTYTAPSLTASVKNQCLTLTWSSGSHSFTANTVPTVEAKTVATAHTHSVTAAGTVGSKTAGGTVNSKSVTPAGTVSQPTFTGTPVDTGTPK